ncbi:growth/differentiation factor 8-like [Limulus polyphemus]|uniref:Growth/differentiation factor 8-like n=1 Tax=Limulus polyphemus TaxID=6850 RepID=A0ABM1B7Y2_LIMPO|nr:growth/differentiation factor 8-like [Limulus polyphemus]
MRLVFTGFFIILLLGCVFSLTHKETIVNRILGNSNRNISSSLCKNCEKNEYEQRLGYEELKQLRLEIIKNDVLRKMGMSRPPIVDVGQQSSYMRLLAQKYILERLNAVSPSLEEGTDSIYGNARNIFLFPENSTRKYFKDTDAKTALFTFQLKPEVLMNHVKSLELQALVKMENSEVVLNQTFMLLEWRKQGNNWTSYIIAIKETPINNDWLKADLTHIGLQWIKERRKLHLEIRCITCSDDFLNSAISLNENIKPLLSFRVQFLNRLGRRKRNVQNCSATTTQCCRDSLHVSFSELGWQDFIIYPAGYDSYYCRGSCLEDVSLAHYHHTTVVHRYLTRLHPSNKPPQLRLCCSPSRLSSITLLVATHNDTIVQMEIPNAVVEECECI